MGCSYSDTMTIGELWDLVVQTRGRKPTADQWSVLKSRAAKGHLYCLRSPSQVALSVFVEKSAVKALGKRSQAGDNIDLGCIELTDAMPQTVKDLEESLTELGLTLEEAQEAVFKGLLGVSQKDFSRQVFEGSVPEGYWTVVLVDYGK